MAAKNPVKDSDKGESSTLNIALHPLVIINISDHYTRQRVQTKNHTTRVFGALLGVQSGRRVEIYNSFELAKTANGGIDIQYCEKKQEQIKLVFPNYDVLGWYSTGGEVQPGDLEINKQILQFNESPLYLLLDPIIPQHHRKELPINIYESELRIVKDEPTYVFSKAPYKIETGEAERIAVDHIAHVSPTGGDGGSMLVAHLSGMQSAIKMLHLRIKSILQFIDSTQKGEIPFDHAIMRQIASMTQLLPCVNSPLFREAFLREYNDTLLVTYLASVTKGTNSINELIDKFNITYERQRRVRGFGGWGV